MDIQYYVVISARRKLFFGYTSAQAAASGNDQKRGEQLNLHQAVVHYLNKSRDEDGKGAGATLQLRDQPLAVSDQLAQLVTTLKKLYNGNTGRGYGSFSNDEVTYPLSKLLNGHGTREWSFLDFTRESMNILRQRIDQSPLATGGYIFFANYSEAAETYMLIASLKNQPGLVFDERLELANQQHIDLSKLHEMARINLSSWRRKADKYVSFAKKRSSQDDFTKYFREFIGCDEFTESKALTRSLLEALRDYNALDGVTPDERARRRQVVFDYCDEKRVAGERVSLRALSARLSDDEADAFLNFINQREDLAVADDFEPDRSVYKGLRRIRGSDKHLTINFDADQLDTRIIYEPENGTLLIKDLPTNLRQQLDNR
ncbi:nucleoid-associated protein [Burkholderia gladioli]|uniref:nucleoid-associated protein n=1 Tax=Burkholderia gladioli TaxID=28095 RepID=UPI0016418FB4|nr:nucleoid-associated protein [Burkholderia gladioli]